MECKGTFIRKSSNFIILILNNALKARIQVNGQGPLTDEAIPFGGSPSNFKLSRLSGRQ